MIAPTTIIRGTRITLRELDEDDVGDRYVLWMNDPEVMRYLESRFSTHTRESLRDYVRRMRVDADVLFLAIVRNEGERHIGNIKLGPIDRHHDIADIGILIGERDCWGQGFATESIALLTEYAFTVLRLRKVTAGAYGVNLGSVRAFIKAGWEQEGVRKDQFLTETGPVDDVLLGRRRTG